MFEEIKNFILKLFEKVYKANVLLVFVVQKNLNFLFPFYICFCNVHVYIFLSAHLWSPVQAFCVKRNLEFKVIKAPLLALP